MVHQHRRLLDAGSGVGPHVQPDGAGIDAREKIPAEKRHQQQRRRAKGEKRRPKRQALGQHALEQIPVALPAAAETAVKSLLELHQRLQPAPRTPDFRPTIVGLALEPHH